MDGNFYYLLLGSNHHVSFLESVFHVEPYCVGTSQNTFLDPSRLT